MQYEVEANGRVRQVVVNRAGDRFAVALDGRTWQVDVARIDTYTLSLLVGAVSHEVTVAADPATGQLTVRIGTTPVMVSLNGRRRSRRTDEGGQAGSGPQRLVAPMPGKIVRVLVKAGEAVVARQPLIVVEAMKMENELRAGRNGTVADVHVKEGASVEAGALLVLIE